MSKKKDKKKEKVATTAVLFAGHDALSNIACARLLELMDGPLSDTYPEDLQAYDEAIFLIELKKVMASGHKKILVHVLDDDGGE